LKKNKISKNWINKQKKDIFVKQSKLEGYKSRAVYKLKEINEKFKILRNGMSVIDLGAAPGSWSQYIIKSIKNVKLLAIDLTEIEKIIRFGINSNEPSRGYPYPQGLISRLAALSETVGLGDRSPSKQSEEVYKKLNKTTIEFSNKIEKLSKETK